MDINNAENTVLPLPSDKDTLKVKNFCSFHIVRLRKQIQDFISFCKTTQTEADTGLYFILWDYANRGGYRTLFHFVRLCKQGRIQDFVSFCETMQTAMSLQYRIEGEIQT